MLLVPVPGSGQTADGRIRGVAKKCGIARSCSLETTTTRQYVIRLLVMGLRVSRLTAVSRTSSEIVVSRQRAKGLKGSLCKRAGKIIWTLVVQESRRNVRPQGPKRPRAQRRRVRRTRRKRAQPERKLRIKPSEHGPRAAAAAGLVSAPAQD